MVAYLNASWIVDKYEIERLCYWQRLECIVDGVLVDDLESPLWKIERLVNASRDVGSVSPITIVTAECSKMQRMQTAYHYHSPSASYCIVDFHLDLPVHLRYGAHGVPDIGPSPTLSLLSAAALCLIYLIVTIIYKNKKCFVRTQDTEVDRVQ